jgi:nicotinamide riboside kinase
MNLFKVAILGPESTGKSELAAALALHFGGSYVPEYAREYLSLKTGDYTLEDVLHCARRQREEEDTYRTKSSGLLFFDTEMINFRVWLSDKYGNCPSWVTEDIRQRYDAYLLTAPDLPFVEDPLRENRERRDFLFEWYRQEIESYGFPYEVVRGSGEARTRFAAEAVERLRKAATKD